MKWLANMSNNSQLAKLLVPYRHRVLGRVRALVQLLHLREEGDIYIGEGLQVPSHERVLLLHHNSRTASGAGTSLPLHLQEVLLPVRTDLLQRAGAHSLLDPLPVTAHSLVRLHELAMFLACPPAFLAAAVVL